MISFDNTDFVDLKIISSKFLNDDRGWFSKLQNFEIFSEEGLSGRIEELYISSSKRGVVRGLHYQISPSQHSKIVWCLYGKIFDVAVDLRPQSENYGKAFEIELSADVPRGVYIPEGFAHGFQSLIEGSVILNGCSKGYSPKDERGVHWQSCGINWPLENAIISEKDASQPTLAAVLAD